ncbi:MAG TPA: TraR/DksA C4-type zinc finger protein [Thermodesulfovibrionales bacterium]|nr:TraR/DksA C4-type zinc finger protein [Thermodesulfovibrionales bacterium]
MATTRSKVTQKKSLKVVKKNITKKVKKTSEKAKALKKVAPKAPNTKTKGKKAEKRPAVKAVKTPLTPRGKESTPKKKLTPREKMIQDIKQSLIMQRNILLNEAEEALNMLPGQTIFPDMGDQASAEIDRSFMLRLRGREQRLLKKIEAAIDKIDSGTFGICEACGEEINIKRLEARPVTSMCIFCKTEQEEEEKLRGA